MFYVRMNGKIHIHESEVPIPRAKGPFATREEAVDFYLKEESRLAEKRYRQSVASEHTRNSRSGTRTPKNAASAQAAAQARKRKASAQKHRNSLAELVHPEIVATRKKEAAVWRADKAEEARLKRLSQMSPGEKKRYKKKKRIERMKRRKQREATEKQPTE